MHVLTLYDKPLAAAVRFERLSAHMASYTAEQQAHMTITSVVVLD